MNRYFKNKMTILFGLAQLVFAVSGSVAQAGNWKEYWVQAGPFRYPPHLAYKGRISFTVATVPASIGLPEGLTYAATPYVEIFNLPDGRCPSQVMLSQPLAGQEILYYEVKMQRDSAQNKCWGKLEDSSEGGISPNYRKVIYFQNPLVILSGRLVRQQELYISGYGYADRVTFSLADSL